MLPISKVMLLGTDLYAMPMTSCTTSLMEMSSGLPSFLLVNTSICLMRSRARSAIFSRVSM